MGKSYTISPKIATISNPFERRHAYTNWPFGECENRELADAGFVYTGKEDILKCETCEKTTRYRHWKDTKTPSEAHIDLNRHCEFAKDNTKFTSLYNRLIYRPMFPYYEDYNHRLSSYSTWKFENVQSSKGLADAGFFNTASFSCIQLNLHFERDIGYYMIQFFVLYWVSFWLTIDAVPARISLGILTVLTMTTQRSAGTASLPRVSYIKAIDVWMGACLVFVFAALLEFAFVNVMERRQIRRVQSVRLKGNVESKPCLEKLERNVPRQPMTGHKKAETIDNVSRVIFPISFILFCVVYWVYYVM